MLISPLEFSISDWTGIGVIVVSILGAAFTIIYKIGKFTQKITDFMKSSLEDRRELHNLIGSLEQHQEEDIRNFLEIHTTLQRIKDKLGIKE